MQPTIQQLKATELQCHNLPGNIRGAAIRLRQGAEKGRWDQGRWNDLNRDIKHAEKLNLCVPFWRI